MRGRSVQGDLEKLMPAAAVTNISGLVSLKLRIGLKYRPDGRNGNATDLDVLSCMPHLTALDLSYNSMACLPPAMTNLVGLESLKVNGNIGFALTDGCVEMLNSLPQLKLLVIDAKAVPVILRGRALGAALPDVEISLIKL